MVRVRYDHLTVSPYPKHSSELYSTAGEQWPYRNNDLSLKTILPENNNIQKKLKFEPSCLSINAALPLPVISSSSFHLERKSRNVTDDNHRNRLCNRHDHANAPIHNLQRPRPPRPPHRPVPRPPCRTQYLGTQ